MAPREPAKAKTKTSTFGIWPPSSSTAPSPCGVPELSSPSTLPIWKSLLISTKQDDPVLACVQRSNVVRAVQQMCAEVDGNEEETESTLVVVGVG